MSTQDQRAVESYLVARAKENPVIHHQETGRWWRYAVLRGDGIPAELDGRWFDLDEMDEDIGTMSANWGRRLEATNRWEQREDGAVAVVYEWTRR